MKSITILLLIVLAAGVANAQKVEVGADPAVDVSRYKTYAWDGESVAANPYVNQSIINAVDRALAAKGLKKVETDPELTVTGFAATDTDMNISSPSWAPGLNSIQTGIAVGAKTWPVTKGTLVIDLRDPKTKNSVWRGSSTQTLNHGPTGNAVKDARDVEKPINKAVEKMFKKFPRP